MKFFPRSDLNIYPENIAKVFGIFPFNPREIMILALFLVELKQLERCHAEDSDPRESFTDVEQQFYERRYEVSCNLYDAKYITW